MKDNTYDLSTATVESLKQAVNVYLEAAYTLTNGLESARAEAFRMRLNVLKEEFADAVAESREAQMRMIAAEVSSIWKQLREPQRGRYRRSH